MAQYNNNNQTSNSNFENNQSQNQGQNQTSDQYVRNQRNQFGFRRLGNSYSNYYNNSNNELNKDDNKETQGIKNDTQTSTNARNQPINSNSNNISNNTPNNTSNSNPTSNSDNTFNHTNSRSNMNHRTNNRNIDIDNTAYSKHNNINQNIDTTINIDSKPENEYVNQNNVKSINSNYSNNRNDNYHSSDENNNHTKGRIHHNNELNIAGVKNSFELNDGGTPVIKLGGQYGFNLEKKVSGENSIGKQGNESVNALEEDVLKISSVAYAERKHNYKKVYCSEKPYPKIEVSGENMDYAVHLLNDYASSLSELTAITSYNFLNLVLEDEYQEIKDAYRGISIVEMHHMHMLGEIIKKLGVLPRYYAKESNQTIMWSSNFVSGDVDMKTTLFNSIKKEEEGIVQYQKHIELIDDNNIKSVLERIILDEEIHVRILQDLYMKYCPE